MRHHTPQALALAIGLTTLGLAGCEPEAEAPQGPALTRVTPGQINPGGTLEISGINLSAYATSPLELVLDGVVTEPGEVPEIQKIRIPVSYDNAGRVYATMSRSHVATLGARTLDFWGSLRLETTDGSQAPLEMSGVALTLFPPNVQRIVAGYENDQAVKAVTSVVGLEIKHFEPRDYGKMLPGGVRVRSVQEHHGHETVLGRRAGIEAADHIVELNGAPILSFADFREAALDAKEHAYYTMVRGAVTSIELATADLAGLTLTAATAGPGVIISGVVTPSRAHSAGLLDGDRLVRIGDLELRTLGADAGALAARTFLDDLEQPTVGLVSWRGPLVSAEVSLPWSAHGVPSFIVAIALLIAVGTAVLLLFFAPFGGLVTVAERRVAGRMQSRIGPNRVGPQGILQFLADGVKMVQKEDLIPEDADPILFRMAPYLILSGVFMAFCALPFSAVLIPQDFNIGILFVLSVTSLVVVGVLMGGWASNNKWSLLGGMRSAAQIVSYEIPAGLAVLPVVLMAGSLSMQEIIRAQGGMPWGWNVFASPALFACFFMFFIAALAEGNRTPFDLPEAESELVSGYNTEYSGMRFGVMAMAEFVNVYVMSALVAALFLGGWQLPASDLLGITDGTWRAMAPTVFKLVLAGAGVTLIAVSLSKSIWRGFSPKWGGIVRPIFGTLGVLVMGGGALVSAPAWLGMEALRLGVFQAKALSLVFVVIWLRWTLPRLRIDQMMNLCWKYLVPFSFVAFLFTAVWEAFAPTGVQNAMRIVMLLFGVYIVAVFVRRSIRTFRATRSELYANPFV